MTLTPDEQSKKDTLQAARIAAGNGEGVFPDSDRTTLSGLLKKEAEGGG